MKLTILGSGTFMPELKRHGPSYLLQVDGQNLIFDLGRGAIEQLMKSKFNIYNIDKIFITHTHFDHIAELFSYIAFIWDNAYKDKFKNEVLDIYGPRGFKKALEGLFKAIQYDKHKHIDRLRIYEFKDKEVKKFGNIRIQGFFVKHSPIRNCIAYRVECNDKVFCYSGDSSKCNALVSACNEADLALIEADLSRKWKLGNVHMSGQDSGEIASKAKVKNLILTHIADHYLKDVMKDLRKSYKGPVKIAKDLMKFNI